MKLNKFTRKSITSMLLSLSLVVSQAASSMSSECIAYADEASEQVIASILQDDGFDSCVNALLNTSADMSITGNLFEAYIGSPFNIYRIDSDMNISYDADTYYFPVICNNDVCAFISASVLEDDFALSCGLYFADDLDTSDGSVGYSLIADEEGNIYSISSCGTISTICNYYNVIDFANTPIETSTLEFELSDSYINTKTNELTDWYNGARTYVTTQLPNYPTRDQGTSSNCWAHVICSMGYYKGVISVFEQVYGAFYAIYGYTPSGGITRTEAYNVIVYLFEDYSPVKRESKLSAEQIRHYIDSDLPVYISGHRVDSTGTTRRHAVALMGYRANDGIVDGFYYMNSQNATIIFSAYNSSECTFRNLSGSLVYTWDCSISLS